MIYASDYKLKYNKLKYLTLKSQLGGLFDNNALSDVQQADKKSNEVVKNASNFTTFIPFDKVINMTENNKNRVSRLKIETIEQLKNLGTFQYLREIVLDSNFNQPLTPGLLPASLRILT